MLNKKIYAHKNTAINPRKRQGQAPNKESKGHQTCDQMKPDAVPQIPKARRGIK